VGFIGISQRYFPNDITPPPRWHFTLPSFWIQLPYRYHCAAARRSKTTWAGLLAIYASVSVVSMGYLK
jgi:hypothetical protein